MLGIQHLDPEFKVGTDQVWNAWEAEEGTSELKGEPGLKLGRGPS